MKVLLSIKPEYVQQIFAGTKRFEYRRMIFKEKEVKTVVVYASSPVRKVVGEFTIGMIISKTPESLWLATKDFAGIDEMRFYNYFAGKEIGYAIEILNPLRYSAAKDLMSNYGCHPPQSFVYIYGTMNNRNLKGGVM